MLYSGKGPRLWEVNGGKRASSVGRFGTGLGSGTTRFAMDPSASRLLDPFLNDDTVAVKTDQVLATGRFANPRRLAMRTYLRSHKPDSSYHIRSRMNRD
jgi:hypothetical protein